jgi:predicted small secreted protein
MARAASIDGKSHAMKPVKTIASLALLASVLVLAACNTVQGVGRDIESVGRAGKDAMH